MYFPNQILNAADFISSISFIAKFLIIGLISSKSSIESIIFADLYKFSKTVSSRKSIRSKSSMLKNSSLSNKTSSSRDFGFENFGTEIYMCSFAHPSNVCKIRDFFRILIFFIEVLESKLVSTSTLIIFSSQQCLHAGVLLKDQVRSKFSDSL